MRDSEYQVCDWDHPMPKGDKGRWRHEHSIRNFDDDLGEYEHRECLCCGQLFTVEESQ